MPLSPGQKLGPYEILAPIGAGGMGEVYKAHDPRLDREVALKIMPPHLLDNSQRRARFQQEARLAAALQHPNVVTIFEIGSSGAADYIAMELVKGRTLDAVISGKGLGLRESLHYAIQVADALAAAHAAGIVHRDLKPGNIMVTDQGQVKVLDFGLAKVTDDVPITESDATLTQRALVQSEAGAIMGSVAYMSPEQAEGKKVDARSDIFAFGAILYEMLCGRRAFQGESKAATMAAVLKSEPKPLAEFVGGLPQEVDRLVMRCLRKDLSRRAQHVSDLKLALEELKEDTESGSAQTPSAAKAASARGRWLVPAGAAILVLGAAGLWAIMRSKTPEPADAFEPVPLTTLPGSEIDPSFSPDGTRVVFAWRPDAARNYNVYVQLIGGGPPLRLTNDSRDHFFPTWSPDGKSIAYWVSDGSKKTLCTIPSLGGPEREIAQFTGLVVTDSRIAWTPDSQWIATGVSGADDLSAGMVFLSPSTGQRIDWAKLNPDLAETGSPAFSSDGKRVAYIRLIGKQGSDIWVADLTADHKPLAQRKLTHGFYPAWTADGREILYMDQGATTNGSIVRIRADGSSPPRRIAGLSYPGQFSLAADGKKLAFSRGGVDADTWRIDLQTNDAGSRWASSSLWENGAAYSPDGKRIAFSSNRSGSREIWMTDAAGENAVQLTNFGGPGSGTARWSPDGTQIAFDARPDVTSDIYVVSAAGGSPRRLTMDPGEDGRPAWSPDGKWIYYSSDRGGTDRVDIWRMPASGGAPTRLTKNGGFSAIPSQDGQWIYYETPLVGPVSKNTLYKIRPDGTADTLVVDESILSLSFTVTSRGLWFLSRPSSKKPYAWLAELRFDDNKTHEIRKFDFVPLAYGLSLSPDERFVLVTKPDSKGSDLLLVENFR